MRLMKWACGNCKLGTGLIGYTEGTEKISLTFSIPKCIIHTSVGIILIGEQC